MWASGSSLLLLSLQNPWKLNIRSGQQPVVFFSSFTRDASFTLTACSLRCCLYSICLPSFLRRWFIFFSTPTSRPSVSYPMGGLIRGTDSCSEPGGARLAASTDCTVCICGLTLHKAPLNSLQQLNSCTVNKVPVWVRSRLSRWNGEGRFGHSAQMQRENT